MTDEEIRKSIKRDLPGLTDEHMDTFMKKSGKTLAEYRDWVDRYIAARKKDNPNWPNPLRPSEED